MTKNLAVMDSGESNLPCVLFLHAFPLHAGQWEREADSLRGRFRTLRPDLPGMGRSPVSHWPNFFEAWVDELVGLLDEKGVSKVSVVGLSMGGYLALRLIERAPERIDSLFLSATHSLADTDAARLKRASGVRSLREGGLESYARDFLSGALGPTTLQTHPELKHELLQKVLVSTPEGVAGGLVALATRTSTESVLPLIKVPVTVVAGAEDPLMPVPLVEGLARAIRGAAFHVVPKSGHLINLEAPEHFQGLLSAHLGA